MKREPGKRKQALLGSSFRSLPPTLLSLSFTPQGGHRPGHKPLKVSATSGLIIYHQVLREKDHFSVTCLAETTYLRIKGIKRLQCWLSVNRVLLPLWSCLFPTLHAGMLKGRCHGGGHWAVSVQPNLMCVYPGFPSPRLIREGDKLQGGKSLLWGNSSSDAQG